MQKSIDQLYSVFLKHPDICTDTRQIKKGAIFFALKGESFNANQFAEQALLNGCSYAVIDEKEYDKGEAYILVENVLQTLQQLAHFHREKLRIPFIGITGTNGKTTTKELLNAVLSQKYNTIATKGNLNNHIGVPLTLLSITTETELAIVEMGANHPGEIKFLSAIAFPDFGLITNIGKAHLEGFGNIQGVINTKKELFDFIQNKNGKLFVNADNTLLMDISKGIERITYGKTAQAACLGEIVNSDSFLQLKWFSRKMNKWYHIQTKLFGSYNFENVMAAICVGEFFEVEPEKIIQAISSYTPSNHRSQFKESVNNKILIDAYNANPTSMDACIRNFMQSEFPNKIAIIGDMLELGDDSLNEHIKIIELLKSSGFEKIILVGPIFYDIPKPSNFICFHQVDETAMYIKKNNFSGYHILLKGSHGIHLEKLIDIL